MNRRNWLFLSVLGGLCFCIYARADVVVPLSVYSVETKRAKDVLVRVIRYNTDDFKLRLEAVKPIEHKLLDFVELKGFSVSGRVYEFSKCEDVFVNSLDVGQSRVAVEFECVLPKASSANASCSIPINVDKFGAMTCTRKED